MSGSDQNRKQKSSGNPTPGRSGDWFTYSGGKRITYNSDRLEETQEKLNQQPAFCNVVPGKSGKGESVDEIAALAKQMDAIYQQMHLLIKATAKALESIRITVQEMDNGLAASYIVDDGVSCTLKKKKEKEDPLMLK